MIQYHSLKSAAIILQNHIFRPATTILQYHTCNNLGITKKTHIFYQSPCVFWKWDMRQRRPISRMYGALFQNTRCTFQITQGSCVRTFSIYSENIPIYSEHQICDNLCGIWGVLLSLFVFYIGLFGGHFSEDVICDDADDICDDAGIYGKGA